MRYTATAARLSGHPDWVGVGLFGVCLAVGVGGVGLLLPARPKSPAVQGADGLTVRPAESG